MSRATQLVFGALGADRKEASTRCAQRDFATVSCPTPGMVATVESGSVRAAICACHGAVTASKLPERRRVGMVLRVTARCAGGALATFHTPSGGRLVVKSLPATAERLLELDRDFVEPDDCRRRPPELDCDLRPRPLVCLFAPVELARF